MEGLTLADAQLRGVELLTSLVSQGGSQSVGLWILGLQFGVRIRIGLCIRIRIGLKCRRSVFALVLLVVV